MDALVEGGVGGEGRGAPAGQMAEPSDPPPGPMSAAALEEPAQPPPPAAASEATTAEPAEGGAKVGWRYSLMLMFAFPKVVWLLMVLEVLDHYRLNGLKFIQTMYVVNDLGFDDVEASFLLGIKGTMDTVFGIAGGFVVDAIGVRKTAIIGLCIGLPGRMIWAFDFSGSKALLYLACFVFSPFGEALLATGLYKVALKKFTTPSIRPFAYAVQYGCFNGASAMADVAIAYFKDQPDEIILEHNVTGLRKFVISTFVVMVLTLVIVLLYLEDVTLTDPNDPEDDGQAPQLADSEKEGEHWLDDAKAAEPVSSGGDAQNGSGGAVAETATDAGPALTEDRMATAPLGEFLSNLTAWHRQKNAAYIWKETIPGSKGAGAEFTSVKADKGTGPAVQWAVGTACGGIKDIVYLRAVWMVMAATTCTVFVAM